MRDFEHDQLPPQKLIMVCIYFDVTLLYSYSYVVTILIVMCMLLYNNYVILKCYYICNSEMLLYM